MDRRADTFCFRCGGCIGNTGKILPGTRASASSDPTVYKLRRDLNKFQDFCRGCQVECRKSIKRRTTVANERLQKAIAANKPLQVINSMKETFRRNLAELREVCGNDVPFRSPSPPSNSGDHTRQSRRRASEESLAGHPQDPRPKSSSGKRGQERSPDQGSRRRKSVNYGNTGPEDVASQRQPEIDIEALYTDPGYRMPHLTGYQTTTQHSGYGPQRVDCQQPAYGMPRGGGRDPHIGFQPPPSSISGSDATSRPGSSAAARSSFSTRPSEASSYRPRSDYSTSEVSSGTVAASQTSTLFVSPSDVFGPRQPPTPRTRSEVSTSTRAASGVSSTTEGDPDPKGQYKVAIYDGGRVRRVFEYVVDFDGTFREDDDLDLYYRGETQTLSVQGHPMYWIKDRYLA